MPSWPSFLGCCYWWQSHLWQASLSGKYRRQIFVTFHERPPSRNSWIQNWFWNWLKQSNPVWKNSGLFDCTNGLVRGWNKPGFPGCRMVARCKFNFKKIVHYLWISFGSSYLPNHFWAITDQNIARIRAMSSERIYFLAIQPWTSYPLVIIMMSPETYLRTGSPLPKPYL